ncbi:CBS domain-containing protein [Paenibacillus selenitireducens]|uniref:CBS domain-containing protein n=1 Tax=Paenibacillus selenitireducens TaxID=1324314 RepID=A0A1T2XAY7_9BACL|nr:CBS domain-containing protein [Paenibacillus selenitireducens]OPA76856.1 CBS domain-containing protein [Paenibacillus selenitireducens]
MQAHEIMIKQVYKVKENDKIRAVIEKFIDHHISGLPVVNDRNEIVGYISDGDIMRYIGKHEDKVIDFFFYLAVFQGDVDEFDARTEALLNANVMDIAKRKVTTVAWNEEIENIAAILGKKQIKKLPVQRNGVLVGIISRGDVIRNVFKIK